MVNNIIRIIKEKNLELDKVALNTGCSIQYLENILTNKTKITIDDIPLLAIALDISPNEIFGIND